MIPVIVLCSLARPRLLDEPSARLWFAWAFSEQFEIGLASEASIGQIQRYCCAYGFVDHVITPNGGLVWMVAGDALDRYVTVPIENRTHNTNVRILARMAFNPPQTFANLMMFHYPWRRENRANRLTMMVR